MTKVLLYPFLSLGIDLRSTTIDCHALQSDWRGTVFSKPGVLSRGTLEDRQVQQLLTLVDIRRQPGPPIARSDNLSCFIPSQVSRE